jgi:hypothetical protein
LKWILILGILFASSAPAQVLQIDVGSSTLINGSGAAATLYLPTSVVYAGVGYGTGRFQYSASDTFKWRDDIVTVGSRQLGFGFNGVGLGLNVDGISIQKKTKKWDAVVFAGAVGTTGYSAPFLLSAASNSHVGGGVFITRRVGRDLKLYTLDAINGGQNTATLGATYVYRRTLSLSGAGGLVNNSKILDGAITYQPLPKLTFFASREDFFAPYRATGNSAGASFSYEGYNLNASINQSTSLGKSVTGESVSGSVKAGIFLEQIGYYRSGTRTLINSNTTEKCGPHWNVSESVSESQGQLSYAFGGGYTSHRLSVSVSHSIVFLINGEGFEQVTGVSLSLRMPHDTVANFSTLTTPFGKTLYLADATSYEQLGSAMEGQTVSHSIGGNVISGICKDDKGEPVFGCAIRIGKEIAFSDNRGEWSIRVKVTKAQPMEVVPEIFASPGSWAVVSAPATAEPGNPTEIVVKRSQGAPTATKPVVDVATPADTPIVGHMSFLKRLWNAALGRG